MVRAISLGITLYATWLLLSGHYTPRLLGLGVASSALAVALARRMDVIDHESYPVHITPRLITYWLWLLKEIVVANLDVAKRVLHPRMPIEPHFIRVKTTQPSELGQVIYANSITLTPGTVSVQLEGDEILVHALTRETAKALETGEMDRRVTQLEGNG